MSVGGGNVWAAVRPLRPAVAYRCQVRAENEVGIGEPSEAAQVTTGIEGVWDTKFSIVALERFFHFTVFVTLVRSTWKGAKTTNCSHATLASIKTVQSKSHRLLFFCAKKKKGNKSVGWRPAAFRQSKAQPDLTPSLSETSSFCVNSDMACHPHQKRQIGINCCAYIFFSFQHLWPPPPFCVDSCL